MTTQEPCFKKARTEADISNSNTSSNGENFEILQTEETVASVQLYKAISTDSGSRAPSFELRLTGSNTKSKEEFQYRGLPVRHWKHEKRSKDPNTAYRPWVRANRRANCKPLLID